MRNPLEGLQALGRVYRACELCTGKVDIVEDDANTSRCECSRTQLYLHKSNRVLRIVDNTVVESDI